MVRKWSGNLNLESLGSENLGWKLKPTGLLLLFSG